MINCKDLFHIGIIFFILLFLGCKNVKDKPTYTFRIGHVANEDHTWHKASLYLGEILAERTDGKIKVEVYPNEQLGKERELIRSIKAGIVDMTITGGTLQNWTEIAAFSDMPFLFKDTVHLQKVIEGELGKTMELTILEESGLRTIANFIRGARHLTSNRPIRTPDDLNGIILRVPNVPSYVVAWSALGAKPTPMAFSEVFTSLQQNTIEAQENPVAMIHSASFYEVQDYLNLTGHVLGWGFVVIGEQQFQKLPDDLKYIFLQAAKDMQEYEHQLFLEKEDWLVNDLKQKGMEFIEIDNSKFQTIGTKSIYKSLSPEMQSFFNKIKNLEYQQN